MSSDDKGPPDEPWLSYRSDDRGDTFVMTRPVPVVVDLSPAEVPRFAANVVPFAPKERARRAYCTSTATSLSEVADELIAEPIFGKSGLISTLVEADGLVRVEMNTEGLYKGQRVKVMLTGGIR